MSTPGDIPAEITESWSLARFHDLESARASSPLGGDPFRDRLLPLDPAAPNVDPVTEVAAAPVAETRAWTDDFEMLEDTFTWAAARLRRIAAQLAVTEQLDVLDDVDDWIRNKENRPVTQLPLNEVLRRAAATAHLLYAVFTQDDVDDSDYFPDAPIEMGGPTMLHEQEYDQECARYGAGDRLTTFSRLRRLLHIAAREERRTGRLLLERRAATRASGWRSWLDRVADDAGLSLLERAILVLSLGVAVDPGVRAASETLATWVPRAHGDGVAVSHVFAFADANAREQLAARATLADDAPLIRGDLITRGGYDDQYSAGLLHSMDLEFSTTRMAQIVELARNLRPVPHIPTAEGGTR